MSFWIKNALALFVGLGACAGSYYTGKSALHKQFSWERAVADVSSSRDALRTATFTYNGQLYTIEVGNGMDRKDERRKATVLFPKDDPGKGEVRNRSMLVIPLVLGVFGLAMIAVAYFSIRHKLSGRPTVGPNDPAIVAQKEEMKQRALEMQQKFGEFRNKTGI